MTVVHNIINNVNEDNETLVISLYPKEEQVRALKVA